MAVWPESLEWKSAVKCPSGGELAAWFAPCIGRIGSIEWWKPPARVLIGVMGLDCSFV